MRPSWVGPKSPFATFTARGPAHTCHPALLTVSHAIRFGPSGGVCLAPAVCLVSSLTLVSLSKAGFPQLVEG